VKRLEAAKRELFHATELKKLTKYSQLKSDADKLREAISNENIFFYYSNFLAF